MTCSKCSKLVDLCVCSSLRPIDTKLQILILQHPQEPDHELGSALLAHWTLPNSTLKIGLSWANLSAALGKSAIPARWAVLYLGSGIRENKTDSILQFISRKGIPIPQPETLDGLVVLDGSWSQAKALWWRNPWLLKLKRAIIQNSGPSLYQELRKEPRKECLSTIETLAETLVALGEPAETGEELRKIFLELLDKKRLNSLSKRQKKLG